MSRSRSRQAKRDKRIANTMLREAYTRQPVKQQFTSVRVSDELLRDAYGPAFKEYAANTTRILTGAMAKATLAQEMGGRHTIRARQSDFCDFCGGRINVDDEVFYVRPYAHARHLPGR